MINTFKALPIQDRQRVINKIINVGSLASPRPKSWKEQDQQRYERGSKINAIYHKGLFDCVMHQLKTGTI